MTSAPWLLTVNTAPWNQLQPVYPRRVAVHRLQSIAGTTDQVGNVGYSGAEQIAASPGIEGEMVLFTGLPASVQLSAAGRSNRGTELPGDAISRPVWAIFIPASAISIYSIRDRDIIIDDESYRYEVAANFWTNSGYQLSTIRQEA